MNERIYGAIMVADISTRAKGDGIELIATLPRVWVDDDGHPYNQVVMERRSCLVIVGRVK